MSISRRKFVSTVAATGAGLTIVPRHVLGRGLTPPSDRVNIAGVGVGGMGRSNLFAMAAGGNNIVAICDVDWDYAGRGWGNLEGDLKREEASLPNRTTEQARKNSLDRIQALKKLIAEDMPKMTRYKDYREMLSKQKDIDAVLVATPDHLHAVVASAAMDLGKHVYVQKPLTWSVHEARALAQKAKEKNLVTQMGNQGHSWDDGRKAVEWIQSGAIGDVRDVHIWTNRPLAYWPQGIPRPEPQRNVSELRWNMNGVMARLANAMGLYSAPDNLAWDLFLGPAPFVEYHPVYHPFNWRGWVDWGVGAIGDMGAHLIDHPFWALDLGYPTSVETVSTPFNKACYPMATKTYYEFPARGNKPPVKVTWYDGGLKPTIPEELVADARSGARPAGRAGGFGSPGAGPSLGPELNGEGGALYIGSKGKLMHETYGLNPQILPKSLEDSVGPPQQKLPRITTSHELNWTDAIKGKGEASTPFSYAARLTEVMLLGIVALRAGTKIYYDGANMRITNSTQANDYLRREYRQGWSL